MFEPIMTKPHPTRQGFWFEIWPMTYGKGRIVETDGVTVDSSW